MYNYDNSQVYMAFKLQLLLSKINKIILLVTIINYNFITFLPSAYTKIS